jgi:iron(III) transport system substrate-binding protein
LPALAASKELIVYTALENEQIGKYLESFKSQNKDIDVKIVRDSTGIITAKLLAEGSNTPADVVWGTAASSLLVLEDRGMIQPYAPKGLDRVEKMLKDKANPPAWVGIDAWECAIVVNTVEAKAQNLPEIKSYQDLLKPEFKGQIVMSNPNSSGTGFLAVAGLIHLMGEKKAFEYLDKLHQNIAMYTHSGSAPAKKAAAGEFAVGISYGYAGINQKKKGAPVDIIFPIEGSGWDVEANALIKKKNIKPEAKKFLDWAISDEAINALKGDYAITAVKMDNKIPDGYSKDPLSQLIKKNDLRWSAKNRERILKEWASRYDGKSEPKK